MNPLLNKVLTCCSMSEEASAFGAKLETKYVRLRAQLGFYNGRKMDALCEAAGEAYASNPTDSNLMAWEQAHLTRHFRAKVTPHGSLLVDTALEAFYQNEVRPWAEACLQPYIDCAEEQYSQLAAAEAQRALEITGAPLGKSEIIERASAVIVELKNLLAVVRSSSSLSPNAIMERLTPKKCGAQAG